MADDMSTQAAPQPQQGQQDYQGILSQILAMAPQMSGQRAVDEAAMPWYQAPSPLVPNKMADMQNPGGQTISQAQLDQLFPGIPPEQQHWMALTNGYNVEPTQNAGIAPMTWGKSLGLQGMGIQTPNAPWMGQGTGWQDDLVKNWNTKGGAQGFMQGMF